MTENFDVEFWQGFAAGLGAAAVVLLLAVWSLRRDHRPGRW